MSINFYYMDGCGHCVTAKKYLSNELSSGEITLKHAKDAPPGACNGFPCFENAQTGEITTGFPGKDKLYEVLGVEMYHNMMNLNDDPTPIFPPGFLNHCNDLSMWYLPVGTTAGKPVVIPSTVNPYFFCFDNLAYIVYLNGNKLTHIPLSDTPVVPNGDSIETITNLKTGKEFWRNKIEPLLVKIFPCTDVSDFDSYTTLKHLFKDGNIFSHLIPQPCENDKSLYCCNGDKGPNSFDTKTIIMLVVIAILVCVIAYLLMSKKQ
jgi:hypothetical protein